MATIVGIAFVVLFVLALVALAIFARRTDKQMDFEQADGVKKETDTLKLGIALGSNASNGVF